MNDLKLDLVIPCFNEQESLPRLFSEIEKFADEEVGFIIVNNGSTDNSKLLLEEFRLRQKESVIQIIHLRENLGYGGGIKAGLKLSSANVLGWIHADLQVGIDEALDVARLLSGIPSGVAKGVRSPSTRAILERTFTTGLQVTSKVITGHNLKDANGQPKVFTSDILSHVLKGPDNFTLDAHLLLVAKGLGLPLVTREINWMPREGGVSSWNISLVSRVKVALQYLDYLFEFRKKIRNQLAD